jgi:DNA-binding MarR family transcriptional regulator
MTDLESFKPIRIQWHKALFATHLLTGFEKALAAYLVNVRLNWKTGQLNPTVATMARDMAVQRRTIQRAVNRLEHLGWFSTDRGNGRTRASNYGITEESIQIARQIKTTCADLKDDSHVTLSIVKPWQERRKRVTPLSHKRRQECHSKSIRENNKKEYGQTSQFGFSQENAVFVLGGGSVFQREWDSRLLNSGRPELRKMLQEVKHEGRWGYWLPARWPEPLSSPGLATQFNQIDDLIEASEAGRIA